MGSLVVYHYSHFAEGIVWVFDSVYVTVNYDGITVLKINFQIVMGILSATFESFRASQAWLKHAMDSGRFL